MAMLADIIFSLSVGLVAFGIIAFVPIIWMAFL